MKAVADISEKVQKLEKIRISVFNMGRNQSVKECSSAFASNGKKIHAQDHAVIRRDRKHAQIWYPEDQALYYRCSVRGPSE